jgi:hypothetical protein
LLKDEISTRSQAAAVMSHCHPKRIQQKPYITTLPVAADTTLVILCACSYCSPSCCRSSCIAPPALPLHLLPLHLLPLHLLPLLLLPLLPWRQVLPGSAHYSHPGSIRTLKLTPLRPLQPLLLPLLPEQEVLQCGFCSDSASAAACATTLAALRALKLTPL